MTFNNSDIQNDADYLREELERDLHLTLAEVFPVLIQRLQKARFAGWHRDNDMVEDLANGAVANFCEQVFRSSRIPDEPLNYLVVVAHNLANKEYIKSLREPIYCSVPLEEDFEVKVDESYEENESMGCSEVQVELFRNALEQLPKRAREAFRLRNQNPRATDQELGELMGIKEDGFRKNFGRAYEELQKLLRPEDRLLP